MILTVYGGVDDDEGGLTSRLW